MTLYAVVYVDRDYLYEEGTGEANLLCWDSRTDGTVPALFMDETSAIQYLNFMERESPDLEYRIITKLSPGLQ